MPIEVTFYYLTGKAMDVDELLFISQSPIRDISCSSVKRCTFFKGTIFK